MTALVSLGARLVRAGGWFRAVSVAGGSALAVVLLALALALPDAMYPVAPGLPADPRRTTIATMLAFVAAPVLALLLVVGRMSSEVRDRRLASLGLLGVRRRGLALVATVENALPAAAGAVLGVGGFLLVRPAVAAVTAASLQAPITGEQRLGGIAAAVVACSVVLSVAGVRSTPLSPAALRAGRASRPGWWRFGVLALPLTAFAVVAAIPVEEQQPWLGAVLWVGVASAVAGVALMTPLASWLVSQLVVRTPWTTATLTGRRIQACSPGLSRRVTVLGVVAFAVPVLAAFAGHSPYSAADARGLDQGPQTIEIVSTGPVTPAQIDQLAAIEGIDGVLLDYGAWPPMQIPGDPFSVPRVFAGTCAQLDLVATTRGCVDGVPAWVDRSWDGGDPRVGWFPSRVEHHAEITLPAPDGTTLELTGLATTITMDVTESVRTWPRPPEIDLVVPPVLLEEAGFVPERAVLVATGGTAVWERAAAAAEGLGLSVDTLPLERHSQHLTQRTTVWVLAAASIAVALLAYALGSVDRARSERRDRARLVALGVPTRLLRGSQLLATLVPLSLAAAVGLGLGWVAVRALERASDTVVAPDAGVVVLAATMTTVGIVAVAIMTLPLIRGRVRAEDLRAE